MRIIDADKFLAYLIFSKHIDGLTCGEVKEAVEICKADVLDKIRDEVLEYIDDLDIAAEICGIFDKYEAEGSEGEDKWEDC